MTERARLTPSELAAIDGRACQVRRRMRRALADMAALLPAIGLKSPYGTVFTLAYELARDAATAAAVEYAGLRPEAAELSTADDYEKGDPFGDLSISVD